MEYASITAHQREVFRGRGYEWYEWVGNPHALLRVDWAMCRFVQKLPWKLRFVSRDEWSGQEYYARVDGLGIVSWLYWASCTRLGRAFREIYYRTILTLEVWGLSYTEMGCYPSWRDIGKSRYP